MFLEYLLNQCSYLNSEIRFGILEKIRFRKHIFISDTCICLCHVTPSQRSKTTK
ncbi:hypothetical protein BC629DRAFT_1530599 [Irpex lacteus]|nr:hypothetical protein BC629DRAFT_1530577 [Irpex lacteus]KAI0771746.1 hypothetical protein BC629DRAFT_1530578 [Irpex lacteus]KAI0771753.1 hypothetical protein BC629DRAFT_1530599 [Irpex lacteus]